MCGHLIIPFSGHRSAVQVPGGEHLAEMVPRGAFTRQAVPCSDPTSPRTERTMTRILLLPSRRNSGLLTTLTSSRPGRQLRDEQCRPAPSTC